jgi:hypothetical protein
MAVNTVLGTTKGGKDIVAVNIHNRSMLKLQFRQGGEMPRVLQTAYSDLTSAKQAVDEYLHDEPVETKKETRAAAVKARSVRNGD